MKPSRTLSWGQSRCSRVKVYFLFCSRLLNVHWLCARGINIFLTLHLTEQTKTQLFPNINYYMYVLVTSHPFIKVKIYFTLTFLKYKTCSKWFALTLVYQIRYLDYKIVSYFNETHLDVYLHYTRSTKQCS